MKSVASGKEEIRKSPPATWNSLLSWLEAEGYPLNSRCGGRGLCRGCLVERETDRGVETIRSCQMTCAAAGENLVALRIPPSSRQDATLHGVSVFELADFAEPPRRPGHGLALDIGTTTVAGAIWDFASGRCLADGSVGNAQRQYGDNVLSRISFSQDDPKGLERMRRAMLEKSLAPLIRSLCQKAGLKMGDLTQADAAGNPVMLHILAGESLDGFAQFPFRPEFLGNKTIEAGDWTAGMKCPLDLLPAFGPFVGSDVAAGALAAGMCSRDRGPALLIDFGTNGEILLKSHDQYFATATAAGPAFEGGRLACGATAAPGVISSLDRDGDQWLWQMAGGGAEQPRGLSGAAYIDFVALGAKEGWINPSGRLEQTHLSVVKVENCEPGAGVRVCITPDLFVSEADIAEILQAKAAIAGGVATLLEVAGLQVSDLEVIYVAGGFGYHLHPGHARTIGLLPDLPNERISLIGNSSLGGASLLLHPGHQESLKHLIDSTRVIELNQISSFEDHFTDALALPEENVSCD